MSKIISAVAQESLPVDLFSYAILSREDEASAREDVALIRSHVEDIAKKGIEIGQALNRQKAKMPHGTFEAWVRDECGLGAASSQRLMKVAREIEAKAHLNGFLNHGHISIAALEMFFSDTTPQEVRDEVEQFLVDGEKVTVAKIRELKAEAKAAAEKSQSLEKILADEKAKPAPFADADAIRAKVSAEIETKYLVDINKLNAEVQALKNSQSSAADPVPDYGAMLAKASQEAEDKNSSKLFELQSAKAASDERAEALQKEINSLKEKQATASILRPDFGKKEKKDLLDDDETRDDDDDADPTVVTEEGAISAFSFNLGVMARLKFSPAEFWKQVGKTKGHKKDVYSYLVNVMEVLGKLNKEYQK